jgi:hypothetical protein
MANRAACPASHLATREHRKSTALGMGAEGLEPSRLHQSTDFHSPAAFAAVLVEQDFENWTLSLPTWGDRRHV